MPLKPFTIYPGDDPIKWAKYLNSLAIVPDPGTITDATFADRAAASVIGNPTAAVGAPTDIASSADRQVLVRRSGVLQFDGIEVADLPSSVATDSEVAAAASAAQTGAESTAATALAAHVAASDPHPTYTTAAELSSALSAHTGASDPHTQYQKESEKDSASGYAGLSSASRVTKGTDTTDDLVIDLATKGLVLKDTQGTPHYWRVTINTSGTLVTTDLGTTKP